MLTLAGCFIRVTPGADGHVTTNLGADCSGSCTYSLAEGETLDRIFTAQPRPGAEFIRWKDSLGPKIAGCPNPTHTVCRLNVTAMDNPLAQLGLQMEALFEIQDGWNVTRVTYKSSQAGTGTLRQVSASHWQEETSRGETFDYLLSSRSSFNIVLTDLAGNGQFLIDLAGGTVSTTQGSRSTAGQLTIDEAFIRPNGWFARGIQLGNLFGLYSGDLVMVDEILWERRYPDGKHEPLPLYLVSYRDGGLRLRDAGDSSEIDVDFESGEVRTFNSDGSNQLSAYVHEIKVALDGWNAREVRIADIESGEPAGYFRQVTDTTWSRHSVNGVLKAEYRQDYRSANRIKLHHPATNSLFFIDIQTGLVSTQSAGNPLIRDVWTVTELL